MSAPRPRLAASRRDIAQMRQRPSHRKVRLAQAPPKGVDNGCMSRSEPRGIIDPSVLRLREATVTAGVWLTYVLCATGGIYVALTWSRPHRALQATLFGVAALCGVAVARLPRARIVRSRLREVFFLGWSVLDL